MLLREPCCLQRQGEVSSIQHMVHAQKNESGLLLRFYGGGTEEPSSSQQEDSYGSALNDAAGSGTDADTDTEVDAEAEAEADADATDMAAPEAEPPLNQDSTVLTPGRREKARQTHASKRADVCVTRGQRALARGDGETALRHINEALEHDPLNPRAREMLDMAQGMLDIQ
jgi:hypothetical protein